METASREETKPVPRDLKEYGQKGNQKEVRVFQVF
jgi:hypothetical protein